MRAALHNVGGWLARRAQLSGARTAVVDAQRSLDYGALDLRAARCAGWLRGRGVARGDRVAILLGNRSAFLETVFAAARLGAIAVPINTRLAPPEIREQLEDCEPRVLVHEAELGATVEKALGPDPLHRLVVGAEPDAYEAALAGSEPVHDVALVSPDDPLMIMYTSGTTGTPKGALLPHRKTLFNALNAQLFFDLTGRDRVLVVVPLFHSFGLTILASPALHAGASVVLQRHFDANGVWRAVEKHGITYLGGVPTMFRALLDALEAGRQRFDLRTLRFLFTAGAAVPAALVHAFHEHGLVLKQGFGQTETSILCCLDDADAVRKAGSVGRPVFHAEVRVVPVDRLADPPERWPDATPGETGEIVVRGPITMLGYWRRPQANAETLRGDWLRTGDLATVDAEGFVTLVGRGREMFISGGENVYPAQVEAVYAAHPALHEIAVVGVPDPSWGEVGRAYVVLEAGARLDPEALRAWGREQLAAFKIPKQFVAVDALPRTASGKIQKHRLPDARLAGADD